MDKRQLVDGCKRGDPASAEALYRDYSGKLMGICRQLFRICGRSGLEGILRADAAGVEAELGVFPDASASGLVQEALLPQMRPVRRGAGRGPQANASVRGAGRGPLPFQIPPPGGNSLFLRIFAAVLRATGENFIFRMVLFAGSNVIVSYGPKTI